VKRACSVLLTLLVLVVPLAARGEEPRSAAPLHALSVEGGVLLWWPPATGSVHDVYRATEGGAFTRVATVEPIRDPARIAEVLRAAPDRLSRSLKVPVDVEARAVVSPTADLGLALASPSYAQVRGATWVDRGAGSGKACRYRVVRRPGSGPEVQVGEVAVTAGRPVDPPAPALTGAFEERVVLRWKRAPFVAYEVQRTSAEGGPFTTRTPLPVAATTDASEVVWTDAEAVADGSSARYRVVPSDLAGRAGPASSTVEVRTADRTAPGAPTAPQVKGIAGGLSLRWRAPAAADLAGFHVWRTELRRGKDGTAPVAGQRRRLTEAPLARDAASYEDRTARAGSAYRYEVTALDAAGNESAPSAPGLGSLRETTPPATPAGLTAVGGENGEVTLSWQPVPDTDLWVYRILHAAGPKGPLRPLVDVPPVPGAQGMTRMVKLDGRSQERHRFAVAAVDRSENESLPTPPVEVRLPDHVPPAAPVIAGLEAAPGGVTVRWTTVAEPDLAGFIVFRREPGKPLVRLTGKALAPETRAFRDLTAPAGAALAYAVSAFDQAGNLGPPSEPRTTTTPAARPSPPAGLTVKATAPGQLSLAWTSSAGTRGTMVYGAATRDGAPRQIGALVAAAALEAPRSAGPFFRVQAIALNGTPSDLSAPVEAPPEAPIPLKPAPKPAGKGK
jgi:hypothetical protein